MADSHKRTWSDTGALTALSSDGSEDSQMPFDHNQKTQEIMNATVTTAKLKSEAWAHLVNYKGLPHRATAYSSKLRLEKPVDPHAILSAMLAHAPTAQGTRYVAAAILACRENLPALGWLADTWLCYLMLPFMGNNDDRDARSDDATPTIREETEIMLDALEGGRSNNMVEQVRIRDGYQCILTGIYIDERHTPNSEAECGGVYVAHMLKRAVGAFKQREPAGPYTTWALIKNYVGWSNARIAEVFTPVNGILLEVSFHSSWNNFAWTLKPVVEDNQVVPHTYDVEVLEPRRFRGDFLKNRRVTFRDRANDKDVIRSTPKQEEHWLQRLNARPLPDPELISFHRAMCHVLHASGAAEAILLTLDNADYAGTPVPSPKARTADELICLIEAVHLWNTVSSVSGLIRFPLSPNQVEFLKK